MQVKKFYEKVLFTLAVVIGFSSTQLSANSAPDKVKIFQSRKKQEKGKKNSFFVKVFKKAPIAFVTTFLGGALLAGGLIIHMIKKNKISPRIDENRHNNGNNKNINNNDPNNINTIVENNNGNNKNINNNAPNNINTIVENNNGNNKNINNNDPNNISTIVENNNGNNKNINNNDPNNINTIVENNNGNSKNINNNDPNNINTIVENKNGNSKNINNNAPNEISTIVEKKNIKDNNSSSTSRQPHDPIPEAEQLMKLGDNCENKKQYSEAIKYYKQASNIYIGSSRENHEHHCQILMKIGSNYIDLKKYYDAIHYYEKAAKASPPSKSHVIYAMILLGKGKAYQELSLRHKAKALFEEAKEHYEKALAICKEKYFDDSKKAAIFIVIATSYRLEEDYDQAIDYYKKALLGFKQTFGKSKQYTDSVDTIIDTYLEKEAKKIVNNHEYDEVIKFYINTLGKDHEGYINFLSKIVNMEKGNRAMKYYKEARNFYEKKFGNQDPRYARMLKIMGDALFSINQHQSALKNYIPAFLIFEKNITQNRRLYNDTIFSIVCSYIEQGDDLNTIKFYEKAFKEYVKFLSNIPTNLIEKHEEEILSHEKMLNKCNKKYTTLLFKTGKEIMKYKDILQPYETKFTKTDPRYARILNIIGDFYYYYDYNQKYTSALNYYNQAKAIFVINPGKTSSIYNDTINRITRIHIKKGDYKKALEVYKKELSENNREYSIILERINKVYIDKKQYKQLIKFYEKNFGKYDEKYTYLLTHITDKYHNKYPEAAQYYKKDLKLYKEKFGIQHEKYATMLCIVGNSYFYNQNFSEAMEYYKKALPIFKSKKNPSYNNALNAINLCYIQLEKYDQLIKFYEQEFDEKNEKYIEILITVADIYREKIESALLFSSNKKKIKEVTTLYEKALKIYQDKGAVKSTNYFKILAILEDLKASSPKYL